MPTEQILDTSKSTLVARPLVATDAIKKAIVAEWINAAWQFCDGNRSFFQFAENTILALGRLHSTTGISLNAEVHKRQSSANAQTSETQKMRELTEDALLVRAFEPRQPTFVRSLLAAATEIANEAVKIRQLEPSEVFDLKTGLITGLTRRIAELRRERGIGIPTLLPEVEESPAPTKTTRLRKVKIEATNS